MRMSQFNPDELHFSKAELVELMEMLLVRWRNNPLVPRLVIRKFEIDVRLFKSRLVKEKDLPYCWSLFCELVDEMRALNERKIQPVNPALDAMQRDSFNRKIITVPEQEQQKPRKNWYTESVRRGEKKQGDV